MNRSIVDNIQMLRKNLLLVVNDIGKVKSSKRWTNGKQWPWKVPVCHFFLINQPNTLFIQIYSVIKVYMFQTTSLPIIRSLLLYIRQYSTVGDFWWCPKKLPETCRVLWQNKFGKIVCLVGY